MTPLATHRPPLAWRKRAMKRTTDCSHDRIWLSACKRYRVVEASPDLAGLPLTCYAEIRCETGDGRWMWDVLARCCTYLTRKRDAVLGVRAAAFHRCERHAAGEWQPRKPR